MSVNGNHKHLLQTTKSRCFSKDHKAVTPILADIQARAAFGAYADTYWCVCSEAQPQRYMVVNTVGPQYKGKPRYVGYYRVADLEESDINLSRGTGL